MGLSLGWSLSRQEVSLTGQTQETNTTNAGVFYRYNLYLNGKDAKHPVALYAGPQMGMTRVGTPQGSTNDFSAGGQFGENFMFSEKLALNVHLIQWDTVFSWNSRAVWPISARRGSSAPNRNDIGRSTTKGRSSAT